MPVSSLVKPAFHTSPPRWRSLGDEVADLCALADFAPDEEQKLGLDEIFAFDHSGKSTAFETCIICARQNLKTGLFKQAGLGWLFLTDQRLVVWSAHEFNTAEEAHRDMAALIENTPFLSKRLKAVYSGAANKSIELKSGARLIFKARTGTGGRGLSGDKVVLDEAFALRAAHMGALLPTLSVRPDPQVVYGSSAGLVESEVLRGVRNRGRAGTSERLAYLEWCAPTGGCVKERCDHSLGSEGCALDRVDNWQAANPLLGRTRSNGTTLTVDYVKAEREALAPAEFARERLTWWDEPGAADIFGPGKWEACFAEPPQGLKLAALGVAVSMDLGHAAIVAGARDGSRVVVKPLQHAPGTEWVVARLVELQALHGAPVVIDGRGPGASLIPKLEIARVGDRPLIMHVASTPEILDAWDVTFGLVFRGELAHANYPELNAAVNGATKRAVGDRTAWGRRTSTTDISPLEAATLAAWAVSKPEGAFVSVYESRPLLVL